MSQRIFLRRGLIAIAFSVCFIGSSHGQAAQPNDDNARLRHLSSVRMLDPATTLPAGVLRHCCDSNQQLAKPGEAWSPTDVMPLHGILPWRRLIWAAQGNDFVVVHFEQGGIAHTYHVVVLRMLPDGGYGFAHEADSPRLENYAVFARALDNRELIFK